MLLLAEMPRVLGGGTCHEIKVLEVRSMLLALLVVLLAIASPSLGQLHVRTRERERAYSVSARVLTVRFDPFDPGKLARRQAGIWEVCVYLVVGTWADAAVGGTRGRAQIVLLPERTLPLVVDAKVPKELGALWRISNEVSSRRGRCLGVWRTERVDSTSNSDCVLSESSVSTSMQQSSTVPGSSSTYERHPGLVSAARH